MSAAGGARMQEHDTARCDIGEVALCLGGLLRDQQNIAHARQHTLSAWAHATSAHLQLFLCLLLLTLFCLPHELLAGEFEVKDLVHQLITCRAHKTTLNVVQECTVVQPADPHSPPMSNGRLLAFFEWCRGTFEAFACPSFLADLLFTKTGVTGAGCL